MEQDDHQDATLSRRGSRFHSLREIMFSLNILSAIGYALLVYVLKGDWGYYFLRTAVRINDLLHLGQINAITTDALRRQHQQSPDCRPSSSTSRMKSTMSLALIAG